MYTTTNFTETLGSGNTIYKYTPNTTDIPDLNYQFMVAFGTYGINYTYYVSTGNSYQVQIIRPAIGAIYASDPMYSRPVTAYNTYITNTTGILVETPAISAFNRDYTDYEITKDDLKPRFAIYVTA